ncbi:homoserine kinase [Chryseomicrobium sp. FSL W7-1435]|uniref:homoserine kinase n=1 Tax=Chryseomicrobium sp. FSL W7-1435 TaxID=2921704 RepID=UPI00315A10CB
MTVSIRVPASTANLGPGFDSIGVALPFYLTVEASPHEFWEVIHEGAHLPPVEDVPTHLIFQTACELAHRHGKVMPSLRLHLTSEIPLARGLGSSAAAIVAACLLANHFAELDLEKADLLEFASLCEGHPDNVAAALYGGCIVSYHSSEQLVFSRFELPTFQWLLAIPAIELKTEKARQVLPASYTREQAVASSAAANMLVAGLATDNHQLVGSMMSCDQFHEPYRMSLIPSASDYKAFVNGLGAYGTAISGAGPTLISVIPPCFDVMSVQEKFPHFKLYKVSTAPFGAELSLQKISMFS